MKTIKIADKTYEIGFDFSVLCQFEIENGKPMDLTEVASSTNTRFQFIHAVLAAFNDEVPTLNDLQHSVTFQDFANFDAAISPLMSDFYLMPKQEEAPAEDDGSNP